MQNDLDDNVDGGEDAPGGLNSGPDSRQRHEQSVGLNLALLTRNLGEELETDVYYGSRRIARRGQRITPVLVAKLKQLEPEHLQFTNEQPRRLDLD